METVVGPGPKVSKASTCRQQNVTRVSQCTRAGCRADVRVDLRRATRAATERKMAAETTTAATMGLETIT